jgi:hypothetical protein
MTYIRRTTLIVILISIGCPAISFADADRIFKENHKAVVTIYTYDRYGAKIGLGSGFIVRSSGIVVTNNHVVNFAKAVKIRFIDKLYKAKVNYRNAANDIAILKIESTQRNMPVVVLGDSQKIAIGERVFVIGSPLGLEKTLSDGIVSGVRWLDYSERKYIQFTAPVSPGSSGGPVFNKDGEVIGIATATLEAEEAEPPAQNLNFAVPINTVKQKIAIRGHLRGDIKAAMNRLFNHKGMMYFFLGIVALFTAGKLPIVNKWLEFLHTLQHELVHIAVAGVFGGAPVAMEVNAQGGTAYTTKSNFIVLLAPYVMPLFCLLILGISFLLDVAYKHVAFVLAGLFYGNFIAKTISSLHMQPDIRKSGGRLIAYPLIFVINVVVLAVIGRMVKDL